MKKWIGLVAAATLMCGCQNGASTGSTSSSSSSAGKPTKLVAGRVDTAVILQSDPDYMTMAQDYLREQTDLRAKTAKKAESLKGDQAGMQELQKTYMTSQKELDKKWNGKTQEFLTTRNTKMQSIVQGICKDKGIDIVLIDSKQYATVEFGAVDITQDVLLKTQGGGAPLNSASPAGKEPGK